MASGAAVIARMVPVVQDLLQIPVSAAGDADDARWRLLGAVLEFLRTASAVEPLLLVLEDLQDADRGTLDLLVYLARHMRSARLLVLGTYRDLEVDRTHPLSAALADLRREAIFQRVQLRGLSVDDVQELLTTTTQGTVPRPFAELLQHRTEGNPLFVHEVLRFVVAEGLMERRDGSLRRVGVESLAGHIPEGLRDVVGRRLSQLSTRTNQLLSIAAVIGRDFLLEILRRMYAQSDAEFEAALEEAVAAAIVEERSVVGMPITYRFTHAFFRQTLYEEIIAPRRIRLHQQIARSMEDFYGRRSAEHASELAEHYAFSADPVDLAKAVEYGELAAGRASGVYAYGEAARQLERTLQVHDVLDPDDATGRCDLLLAVGENLIPAGETERLIAQVAPEALAIAEHIGDRRRAFHASRLALDSLDAQGAVTSIGRPDYAHWAALAGRYAEPDSIERVHADLALASACTAQGRLEEARALRVHALALARQHDDAEALFKAAFYHLIYSQVPYHWSEQIQLAEEATSWPRVGVSGRVLGNVLWVSACLYLAHGERPRALELWGQLEELADQTGAVTLTLYVLQRDVILALVDGRLEEAIARADYYVARAEQLGAPVRARQFHCQMIFYPALYLDRLQDWLSAVHEYAVAAGPSAQPLLTVFYQAMCLGHLGRLDEARALVAPYLTQESTGSGNHEQHAVILVLLLQVAVLLSDERAARALSDRLACISHLSIGEWAYTCLARQLGAAAALCRDTALARTYYARALESANKIQFRPEIALTHLELAELLLKEPQDESESEGLDHLNHAIEALSKMNMQRALQRAHRLLQTTTQRTSTQTPGPGTSEGLTAREREVAMLVAQGHSNRDIGETLVITEGTVEVHVKHILNKLGFRSRSQVAAWASGQVSHAARASAGQIIVSDPAHSFPRR